MTQPLPGSGGSYTRDPDTGALSRANNEAPSASKPAKKKDADQ